ncbi:LPS assembly lipoprotein LptE [Chachezhania sediminis]|uniref:LPS assembly lipoprotein LptE n=1 Tax=Chachezhania sediminis TaxID=2599291 RepID=UPI00131EA9BA|nr:LPS assembly lipoprotein LptE [Chachezhania sediminis]
MWWSDRITGPVGRRAVLKLGLAGGAAAGLSACGFTPVYGPGGTGTALRNTVVIDKADSVEGYLFVQAVETQLGHATQPTYRLAWDMAVVEEGQAITPNNETTRYSVIGAVNYRLMKIGSDDVLASGRIESFTGYSATGTTVETLAAERDAHARLMALLAERVVTRLFATADLSG